MKKALVFLTGAITGIVGCLGFIYIHLEKPELAGFCPVVRFRYGDDWKDEIFGSWRLF